MQNCIVYDPLMSSTTLAELTVQTSPSTV